MYSICLVFQFQFNICIGVKINITEIITKHILHQLQASNTRKFLSEKISVQQIEVAGNLAYL